MRFLVEFLWLGGTPRVSGRAGFFLVEGSHCSCSVFTTTLRLKSATCDFKSVTIILLLI